MTQPMDVFGHYARLIILFPITSQPNGHFQFLAQNLKSAQMKLVFESWVLYPFRNLKLKKSNNHL